jgi:hypothetical protein
MIIQYNGQGNTGKYPYGHDDGKDDSPKVFNGVENE